MIIFFKSENNIAFNCRINEVFGYLVHFFSTRYSYTEGIHEISHLQRPFGVDLHIFFSLKVLTHVTSNVITEVPRVKIFSEKRNLQIDSKWSVIRKKKQNHRHVCCRRQPIFWLEYVNTSYYTTFHRNLLINMACIHKSVLIP